METLTALVAWLLVGLHGLTGDGVCPGGWPWAVSLLGVGVGLLPAAGAAGVALWRRRTGAPRGLGQKVVLAVVGPVTAGVAPLLVFRATGYLFAAVAARDRPAALTVQQVRSMGTAVCVVGPQSRYLGAGRVGDLLAVVGPGRADVVAFVLLVMPVVAALCTGVSARLAMRRGPRWPVRLFWLPLLVVVVLTRDVPPGVVGHLWFGAAAGAFLGMPVVLALGRPAWAVVHRPAAAGRLAARYAAREPEPVVALGPPRGAPPPSVLPAAVSARSPTGRSSGGPGGARARFRLVRRLGSGGFGRVWLAYDARLGQTVALKAAYVRDADTEERIRREARALAAVRHPHCVRIYDLVPAAGDPGLAGLDGMVIVMEYVRGESLGELVRTRGTVDDVAAARVWSAIAGALDAAHGRGVLHRDVKPGNVVVDADGRAHLIDFGIARQTGDASLTAVGFVVGTPDFLAPEVAAGGPATAESDAWQLAATVGYALSGHPPRGEHADAVSGLRAAVLGRPPTHLPTRSAHLALLRAALDDDPARRPTLRAVHAALETWLRSADVRRDGPVTAVRPTR